MTKPMMLVVFLVAMVAIIVGVDVMVSSIDSGSISS
jgi:hypothetical protein